MKIVRFLGNSEVDVVDAETPRPAKGEVLVEIMSSALCGSEMGTYVNPPDPQKPASPGSFNPGHEIAGRVVEANQTSRVKVGDRVAINIITGCGECLECRQGDRRFCLVKQWYVFNGHAQYVAVPEVNCLPLPESMGYDLGVLIGGDTLGVASRALAMVPMRPREKVLVSGAGPVGLGFVALLAYFEVDTIVSEPSPYRRALVEKMGARTIDPLGGNPMEQLLDLNGERVHMAIDASGKSAGVNFALDAIRPRGRMIFAGAGHQASINPWRQFLEKEVTAHGVWYFTDADYFRLVGLYQQGLNVEHLITHRFDIADAALGYQAMAHGESGKVVLHANGPVDSLQPLEAAE